MLVQLPVLLAVYAVVYAIPAYIDKIKMAYYPLVTDLLNTAGGSAFIQGLRIISIYTIIVNKIMAKPTLAIPTLGKASGSYQKRMKTILIRLIQFYQKYLSPMKSTRWFFFNDSE